MAYLACRFPFPTAKRFLTCSECTQVLRIVSPLSETARHPTHCPRGGGVYQSCPYCVKIQKVNAMDQNLVCCSQKQVLSPLIYCVHIARSETFPYRTKQHIMYSLGTPNMAGYSSPPLLHQVDTLIHLVAFVVTLTSPLEKNKG